jgi:hypothetical protein
MMRIPHAPPLDVLHHAAEVQQRQKRSSATTCQCPWYCMFIVLWLRTMELTYQECCTCRCEEGEHNDLATLFLSSSHHTIVNLFSMGHNPGEAYVVHFTQGSLVLFVVIYLILMSVGAGVAIPGGLFMPSIMVSVCCKGAFTLHAGLSTKATITADAAIAGT